MIDLRLGRWEDVLADVEVDAVITDPPYSARNHAGHNAYAGGPTTGGGDIRNLNGHARQAISYAHWTADDVAVFVASWSPRTRGWIVALTSHDLIPAWESAYTDAGRYVFAPVPCVISGMGVRMFGDGPSSWAVYAMVARPRKKAFLQWGTLPGAYSVHRSVASGGGRGKPLDLMRALVSDYSRRGDLVCDPCAGWGTTLAAAIQKGRRAIGSEVAPEVHAEALRRLERVQFVDLFEPGRAKQEPLL